MTQIEIDSYKVRNILQWKNYSCFMCMQEKKPGMIFSR